jgi:hypothetical protein
MSFHQVRLSEKRHKTGWEPKCRQSRLQARRYWREISIETWQGWAFAATERDICMAKFDALSEFGGWLASRRTGYKVDLATA